MEKFYLKSNNEEVKLGEVLYHPVIRRIPFGVAMMQEEVTLDEELLAKLLKNGAIYKKPIEDTILDTPKPVEVKIHTDLQYYFEKIAKKQNWHTEKVCNILNAVSTLNPMSAMNIVLREIAIEIDQKYSDHIQNSPKIYIISALNGKIGEVNKAHIANYRNIAAFRSIEDAKIACKIVSPILRGIFKNGKSK